MSGRKVIVSCAVTGGADSAHINPAIPRSPERIASEVLAARKAGAAIAHIHVRDPETGKPSRDLAYYREAVARIRDAGSDVLINLTTGPGGGFAPGTNHPLANFLDPIERLEHVLDLRPQICSLDVATMNFGPRAMVNVPGHLSQMAKAIRDAGVKPELEVFDLGHVQLAAKMIADGEVAAPALMQLCLGIAWGAPATAEGMIAMRSLVPPGVLWSSFGISRDEFPMVAQAVILGGHVRVGLEDNLYLSRGVLAPGNAALVERAVVIVEALGASVATPQEAAGILGIA
ncbi:MAG TPA: 3-keto-5-aminohexanoate cleavage protein [Acetobacteraceae bacterium]|nr:3-keto-5-aminohexanoate cleavage protein [Acetobacteraceae bacterium]